MKKAAAFIVCVLLALCVALPCALASTNFELPELNMTADIPEGFVVFTRGMPEDAPGFAMLGTTKTDIDGKLITNNEYLHAVMPDASMEIAISMVPDKSDIFDYNLLSESDLNKGVEQFLKTAQTEYPDSEITGHFIYKQGQAIYICFDYSMPADGADYYYRAYGTVINGKAIQIKLSSNAPITGERQDMLKGVIDSVTFTEVKHKPASVSQYWWLFVIIAAILIVGLRIAKQRRKAKEAKDGGNAGMKYNGRM